MAPNFEELDFCVSLQMSSEPRKLRLVKIWRYSQLNMIRGIARHHTACSMALLCYFSKASEVEKLPDPQGALAKDIPSFAIFFANSVVQCILQLKVDPLTLTCYL